MAPIPSPTLAAPALRRVALVSPPGVTRQERQGALNRARDARRQLEPRHERFAHLKRVYD